MRSSASYGTKSYLIHLACALGLVLLANAFVFLADPALEVAQPSIPLAPPGYVIGIVWVLLFVAMSTSRWLTLRAGARTAARPAPNMIAGLILLCAIYPVYTQALSNLRVGLYGDIVTAIVALVTARLAYRRSFLAGNLILLVVVWLCFATYLIVEQLRSR